MVVAPTFPLTNDLNGAKSVTADFANQPQDVRFVLDRVLRENGRKSSPLHGRIDPRRIGLAGHSLGGGTAYAVAFNGCCRDRRIDAVIAMDAVKLPFDGDYRFRGKPLLLIHLVKDPVVPFATSEGIYAVAFAAEVPDGAAAGRALRALRGRANPHDEAVIDATTAFWDAYVKHRNGSAKRVIRAGTQAGLSTVTAEPPLNVRSVTDAASTGNRRIPGVPRAGASTRPPCPSSPRREGCHPRWSTDGNLGDIHRGRRREWDRWTWLSSS